MEKFVVLIKATAESFREYLHAVTGDVPMEVVWTDGVHVELRYDMAPDSHSGRRGSIDPRLFTVSPYGNRKPDGRVPIGFEWVQLGAFLRVTMECYEPVAQDSFVQLLKEIRQIWQESRETTDAYLKGLDGEAATAETAATDKPKGKSRGINGGTMERVKEALGLIRRGEPQSRACKKAHIDPRTYEKWVLDITCPEDEEDE